MDSDPTDLTWYQLPADAGQIIDVTYAAEWTEDNQWWLYCRSRDRSTGGIEVMRAAIVAGDFEPWNGVLPDHGEWQPANQ